MIVRQRSGDCLRGPARVVQRVFIEKVHQLGRWRNRRQLRIRRRRDGNAIVLNKSFTIIASSEGHNFRKGEQLERLLDQRIHDPDI